MITRKEFERQYSADLLPSTFSNYSIGDLWDWKGFIFNRHLVANNMNIAEVCDDANLLDVLESIPMQDASLPDVDLTDDFKSDPSLTLPSINLSLKDVLDITKVESFHFAAVQGKNAIGYNSRMLVALDNLRKTDFETYSKQIRGYEVVVGLFYAGSVNLTINKSVSNQADIDAKLKSIATGDTKLSIDTSDARTIKYVITNSKCPFAAEFKLGREL